MKKYKYLSGRRVLPAFGAAVLAAALGVAAIAPPAQTASAAALNSSAETEDFQAAYYDDDYAYLGDEDSVYDSLTLEKAYYLFQQEGNYLILFGGSWCGNTTPVIGYINEVAKEYGVETIYNLDFRLDGTNRSSHVRETNGTSYDGASYNYLYGEIVTRYLTNLNDYVEYTADSSSALTYTDADGEEVTVPKVQVPFLFLYNKDNVDENGDSAPVVAGYEKMKTRSDFVSDDVEDEEAVEAYKKELEENVFSAVEQVTLSSFTDADYLRIAYNEKSGVTLFEESDQINIEIITYKQLEWLLQQEGNYLILFGGSWCGNTQAVIGIINDFAVANGVTVYNFDTKLDGGYAKAYWGYSKDLHIRDNDSEFANLYVDLVTAYLTNIETEYDKDTNGIYYTDSDGNTVTANKLQVPYFFAYNKDAVDAYSHSTPILEYVEKMFYLFEETSDYYDYSIYKSENYSEYVAAAYAVIEAYAEQTGQTAVNIIESATDTDESDSTAPADDGETASESDDGSGSGAVVKIVAAVAVIAVAAGALAGVVLWTKRKGKKE